LLWSFGAAGRASTVVHDPIHTVLNVAQQVYGQVRQEAQHAEDITKYTTMIQKQLAQINQLTNIVNQNVEQQAAFRRGPVFQSIGRRSSQHCLPNR
jgi:hypothetical protein